MPLTIYIEENNAVQFSPAHSKYYNLNPLFDETQSNGKPYLSVEINEDEPVILRSKGIHHCHTIIVRDIKTHNYFTLHVSPQALRRPYDPNLKKAGKVASSGFAFFDTSMDDGLTNISKPAYIDLDPYYYDTADIGTHNDSELEIIIVVNNEHWNEEKVKEEIVSIFQQRVPGKIVKSNVIVNEALDHAYYYDVEFNPQTDSLTLISRNGLYTELYDNAFYNNKHKYADQLLPKEQQIELRAQLNGQLEQSKRILQSLFKCMSSDRSIEQLMLNPPQSVVEFCKDKNNEILQSISVIEDLIRQSKFPVIDLGSPLLYESYKLLGILYSTIGNYDLAVLYLSKGADYAMSMRKAEYDEDKFLYCALAGAAYERSGDIESAYSYYKEGRYGMVPPIDEIDATLRLSRVASQMKGKELESLENALDAKQKLKELTLKIQNYQFPEKETFIQMLNKREIICQNQIDALKDHLVDYRHHSDALQQEYDNHYGITKSFVLN